MEKANVYYTDFRTKLGEGLPTKLKRLIRAAGIGEIDMDNKFVAIKMHFGELGNLGFLRPNYAKALPHRLQHPLCGQPEKRPGAPVLRLGKRLHPHDCGLSHPHW